MEALRGGVCKNSQTPWGMLFSIYVKRNEKQTQRGTLGDLSPILECNTAITKRSPSQITSFLEKHEVGKCSLFLARKTRRNFQVVNEHFITCLLVWLSLVLFKCRICIQDMKWI